MTRPMLHPAAPSGTPGKGSHRVRGALRPPAFLATALLVALGGSAVAQAPSAGWPIEVVDDTGTTVTLAAPPERVVSLSPANTEIVFALGAGDRLLGGSDFDDHPAEAAALPDVATYQGVLMEQLVALEPQLVLAGGNGLTPDADIVRMRELGYPVVVVHSESVDDVLTDIRLIGDALGGEADAAAEALTAQMDADLERITGLAAAEGTTPRTFYEIGDQPELYGPAPQSFVADMVARAGGDAITTTDPAVYSLPLEQLVAADPEVIVLGDAAYGVCPDLVAARPGWADITAVREGAIRPVNDTVITRPGPRLAEGLASLARAVHPDLADALGDFPPDPAMCGIEPAASTAP